MFMLFAAFAEIPNFDEYRPITGRLEYCREQGGRSSYIAIGFYDMPTEYRLSSIYLREFDYSFFDEVEVGDTVTIFVGNSEDHEFSLRNVSKKLWNHYYYMKAGDKEYFSRQDYIRSHERNNGVAFVAAVAGAIIFVVSALALTAAYFVCKKRAKGEEIEIYK